MNFSSPAKLRTDVETVAQVRRYTQHLATFTQSYGTTPSLTIEQRVARDTYEECGQILTAILNNDEWALHDDG